MGRTVRLRRWQREALERFEARPDADFLAVATPGAGKTTFALVAARRSLGQHRGQRVVVIAPTQALKRQWADAAAQVDLHLEHEWSAGQGALPRDVHGVVTTYQQLASSATALRALAVGSFVILDELHHAGDDRAWGDGVRAACEPARSRLALSGTPFRSDTQSIPFVRYDDDEAVPDYEYGYGEALADRGVVRPVYFPRIDGLMEWLTPDGTHVSASFADALDADLRSQRLRTALAVDGEWLPEVLRQAHRQLRRVRDDHPAAAGLVIATDQEHARGITALMRSRLGIEPVLALSEDPRAADRIARFARSDEPWIIAVRMISEGVDIPRLRVGVFATTTTTELFFRQAVGRLVRWTRGLGTQRAYLFVPDDPRLRLHAAGIAEQRRHLLRRREDGEIADEPDTLDELPAEEAFEQLSLFAAISSVAIGSPLLLAPADVASDEEDVSDDGEGVTLIELPVLPGAFDSTTGTSVRERRGALRDANANLARDLARLSGMSHAQVNAELNRLVGLRRVSEATVDELALRVERGDRWRRRLIG